MNLPYHLAQVNIGRILAPMDSPVMADFAANLDRINALAEASNGFVWRLKDETNNATSVKFSDDQFIIVNLSVWKDIDSLFAYVYQSAHVEIFKRRKEWFEKMPEMHMALWYLPVNQVPTVTDSSVRLRHLQLYGETPFAFSFKKKFTPEEAQKYQPSLVS